MFKLILSTLKPILLMIIQLITKEALELVLEVVKEVSTMDLTNSEKREQAYRLAKVRLSEAGHDLKDSVVNLLIELAVSKLKNQ